MNIQLSNQLETKSIPFDIYHGTTPNGILVCSLPGKIVYFPSDQLIGQSR